MKKMGGKKTTIKTTFTPTFGKGRPKKRGKSR